MQDVRECQVTARMRSCSIKSLMLTIEDKVKLACKSHNCVQHRMVSYQVIIVDDNNKRAPAIILTS